MDKTGAMGPAICMLTSRFVELKGPKNSRSQPTSLSHFQDIFVYLRQNIFFQIIYLIYDLKSVDMVLGPTCVFGSGHITVKSAHVKKSILPIVIRQILERRSLYFYFSCLKKYITLLTQGQ